MVDVSESGPGYQFMEQQIERGVMQIEWSCFLPAVKEVKACANDATSAMLEEQNKGAMANVLGIELYFYAKSIVLFQQTNMAPDT